LNQATFIFPATVDVTFAFHVGHVVVLENNALGLERSRNAFDIVADRHVTAVALLVPAYGDR
jgi:hypothetical protein